MRSAAALPFLAPVVAVSGRDEVEGGDAGPGAGHQVGRIGLYSKFIWSVRPAVPRRHSSPL